jgi:hypothetical protein
LGGLSLREVVLVDGMVFDLAVLMYNSTTDDRIDFSSLSDNLSPCFSPLFLFLFWSGALLEILSEAMYDNLQRGTITTW